jgi:hypothetical protein
MMNGKAHRKEEGSTQGEAGAGEEGKQEVTSTALVVCPTPVRRTMTEEAKRKLRLHQQSKRTGKPTGRPKRDPNKPVIPRTQFLQEHTKLTEKQVAYRDRLTQGMKERSADAFEKYIEMGNERSYPRLSALTGYSVRSIMKWASVFCWQEKVRQLTDVAISSSVVEPVHESMKKRKSHLRLIDFMLKDAAILDENGELIGSKVKLNSMQDVQRALDTRESILSGNERKNHGMFGPNAQIGQAVFIIKK